MSSHTAIGAVLCLLLALLGAMSCGRGQRNNLPGSDAGMLYRFHVVRDSGGVDSPYTCAQMSDCVEAECALSFARAFDVHCAVGGDFRVSVEDNALSSGHVDYVSTTSYDSKGNPIAYSLFTPVKRFCAGHHPPDLRFRDAQCERARKEGALFWLDSEMVQDSSVSVQVHPCDRVDVPSGSLGWYDCPGQTVTLVLSITSRTSQCEATIAAPPGTVGHVTMKGCDKPLRITLAGKDGGLSEQDHIWNQRGGD